MIGTIVIAKAPAEVVFVPPTFDANANTGTPSLPEGAEYGTGAFTGIGFGLCNPARLEGQDLYLYFSNPTENAVWIKLRIYDKADTVLGESGLIRPGEYLESMPLNSIQELSAPLTLKIMCYEPDTYYSKGSATISIELTN